MQLEGRRVLVVGLGRSGRAAVDLLGRRGARVLANDAAPASALDARWLDGARSRGVELSLGGHDPSLAHRADLVVVSPGVASNPLLDAAERAGVPVVGEVELAASQLRAKLVGITGSNGKSTVTTLVGKMLEPLGRPLFVGGNLGTPLCEAVDGPADRPDGIAVVELSSFQLERARALRVHVAALLNVTENHIDRHGSFAAYAAAKGRIFLGQHRQDAACVPDADALCLALARAGAGRLHTFGGAPGPTAVGLRDGRIVDQALGLELPVESLGIRGAHNARNAAAAVLVARLAGAERHGVERALRSFRGLPHRTQHVARVAGVDWWNDSKSTSVAASVAAIEGIETQGRVVLVAGGRDKGGSYEPLAAALGARGRAVVLLGEAAGLMERALVDVGLPIERACDLSDAVRRAARLARPGDAVLLSPACSSLDMFPSFEARGEAFVAAVQALASEAASSGGVG
ncbi:MAG: UDP-N-acetylmuramoyl-L-alanine--D-glutamate ligase [Myxococcota bacterium]|nr:UDP-N-acetylmuramoyl-L-alanine--D-glutamate ligase [Myxococcota bacterium]